MQTRLNLNGLTTEKRNPRTQRIDTLPTLEMARLMNEEDKSVPHAVERALPAIAAAIDAVEARLRAGGRLLYIGAGTSGRLGVLDASECPPTFGTPPTLVQGVVAGGPEAIFAAVEGAEDDAQAGAEDLRQRGVGARDAVVGLTASGRTPYVVGALEFARRAGALAVAVTCNEASPLAAEADIAVEVVVGPEVLSGSTRLKAGTAQKLVLNMLSTGVMIRLGKAYGNLMVDVKATNEKLRDRARRIVAAATGLSEEEAEAALRAAAYDAKLAICMQLTGCGRDGAARRLAAHGGCLARALDASAGCAP